MLSYASIAPLVLDLIDAFLLHVLCVGGSSMSFFIMCWATSRGDIHGIDGYSTLGGSATYGGVSFWSIWGVGMRLER